MANKNKNILTRNTGNRVREFNYTYGNTSLKFSLRTDIKTQLKDFLGLLKAAVEDVEKELKDNA